MDRSEIELLMLKEDPEFINRLTEMKAEILEETRDIHYSSPEASGYYVERFVPSYLASFGGVY